MAGTSRGGAIRLTFFLVLFGCDRAGAPIPAPEREARAPDMAVGFVPVSESGRCGECHEPILKEWRESAHARAERTPLYRAMREKSGAAARCDRCHAPYADPSEFGVREGVNCDVCHTIQEVRTTQTSAIFTLRTNEQVKYGPLCDAADHYYHKMGCSPLHEEGQFCAACHLLHWRTPAGGEVPVFTEFAEWRDSDYADIGMDCQRCHMPGTRREVARGSGIRTVVHGHGTGVRDGNLRQRALGLQLELTYQGGGKVHVLAVLTNTGGGHMVPSGLPGRQVLLRLRALDASGGEQDRVERSYGRVLANEHGAEVPFYAATQMRSDNRLAPHESRKEELDLNAPGPGELRVEVLWRAFSPALRAGLPAPAEEEVPMLAARAPLRPLDPSGQRSGPRRLSVGHSFDTSRGSAEPGRTPRARVEPSQIAETAP